MNDSIIVSVEGIGELEFPDGTDPSVIQATVKRLTAPSGSHPPTESTTAYPLLMGRPLVDRPAPTLDQVTEQGPMIGGLVGGALGGIPGAIVGGSVGALGRDLRRAWTGNPQTPKTAMAAAMNVGVEGGKQGALEGAGQLVGAGLQKVARPIMRGAIPPSIAKKFSDVDLADLAVKEGAIPGSAKSADRITTAADQAGEDLATRANFESRLGFPRIKADQTLKGAERLEQEALSARKFDRASDIRESMAKTRGEYGAQGLSRQGALTRKQILQQEGKAALNAPSPRQAAIDPQLANAERAGLVQALRDSPELAKALDKSQGLIGLNRVMQAQQYSTPITRLRSGGMASMLASPMGMGATALTADRIGQMVSQYGPALTRAAILQLLSQPEP